jgi:hypothetical protein
METNPVKSDITVMTIPMNPMSPRMKRRGRKRNPGGKGEAPEPEVVVICIG